MSNDDDDHSRTIVHIDLDCFYAQAEMIKNPLLRDVPLGIQQKNLLVTCNYIAREFGVKKCTSITDAKTICPSLVLVNGEDLHDYRKLSYQVTAYLQQYSPLVERLGLDENFIDITTIVNDKINNTFTDSINVVGHVFGEVNETCQCGCLERLKIGSIIAQEMREGIKRELNLTSCAGIAHSKLLAKLVGSVHKPNQQTTIFPSNGPELLMGLKKVRRIPGVGQSMAEILERLNIVDIEDLHNFAFEKLQSALTAEKAKWLLNVSYGKDVSLVKPSGKPQTIGLEDSCKTITAEIEIREKFNQLLKRLIILVSEDGRMPTTIKVTIRKLDRVSHRESRQCNISPSLFNVKNNSNNIYLDENSENKLMSIIMSLFNKLVNISQSYHITLLGLSFTKFQERSSGRNSIASYFVKDVAVQSITSIANIQDTPNTSSSSHNVISEETVEAEVEPSSKKSKMSSFANRFHKGIDDLEYSLSPSRLRVSELHINSKESDSPEKEFSSFSGHIECPPNADETVFQELPIDVQGELWKDWKRNRATEFDRTSKPLKKSKPNTILNYLVKN